MSSTSRPGPRETGLQERNRLEEESRTSLQDRFGKSLVISTKPDKVQSAKPVRPIKRITPVPDFTKLYVLGKEVMPSGHKFMAVHFARRKDDGLECVVKLRIKPHCFRTQSEEISWRRSTEYLLNMPRNDNIARIYEVLEDPKALYIVMEKVNGMDLFETLAQERPTVDHAREIIQQLLRAMAHLHAEGAVHKDLKLENVMVDCADLSPKSRRKPSINSDLSDLGLTPTSVKVIDFDTVDQWAPNSPVGREVVGTDQYIAQEAYAGKYSPLSDVFAVGVIAYRLLCGRFPFHAELFDDEPGENWVGSPKMDEIRSKLQTAKVDFSHKVFRLNPDATDLLSRMLSHRENQRPSAAAALQHPWFEACISPKRSSTSSNVSRRMGGYPSEGSDLSPKKQPSVSSEEANREVSDSEVLTVRSRSAMPCWASEDVAQEERLSPLCKTDKVCRVSVISSS